jgi:CBS domain-containing protein
MAIAGPIASVLLASGVAFVSFAGRRYGWPVSVHGTLSWLAGINLLLAAFNMIPAFPLDGGRVLRSALWHWKRSLKWATRITSALGSGFGLFLIVMGVVSFVAGNFIGGMWWFLIGMFVRNAAQMSYRQLIVRRALEGEPVRRFMQREIHSVPPDATLSEFLDDYVYRHHHKLFPVVQGGNLLGCMSTRRLKEVPREEWHLKTVGEVLEPCSDDTSVRPDADAMETLIKMSRTGTSRLMVVNERELQGILSLKDLVRFISLKLEIEEDEAGYGTSVNEFAGQSAA